MKISDLISAKANDLGRRFTRRLRARVALATGLAAVALLGGSAATAQASTTPSAVAHVAAATTVGSVKLGSGAVPAVTCNGGGGAIIDEHHGSPLWSFVPGNGNNNLYFDNSGAVTDFCPGPVTMGNMVIGYQFFAAGTNVCLALNASAHSIQEGSAAACSNIASYTMWELSATSSSGYYLYQSVYDQTQCIYDNTQRPATYATCNLSNQFEWLGYP